MEGVLPAGAAGGTGVSSTGTPRSLYVHWRSISVRSANTFGNTGLPLNLIVAFLEFSTRIYNVSRALHDLDAPEARLPLNTSTPSIPICTLIDSVATSISRFKPLAVSMVRRGAAEVAVGFPGKVGKGAAVTGNVGTLVGAEPGTTVRVIVGGMRVAVAVGTANAVASGPTWVATSKLSAMQEKIMASTTSTRTGMGKPRCMMYATSSCISGFVIVGRSMCSGGGNVSGGKSGGGMSEDMDVGLVSDRFANSVGVIGSTSCGSSMIDCVGATKAGWVSSCGAPLVSDGLGVIVGCGLGGRIDGDVGGIGTSGCCGTLGGGEGVTLGV